MRYILIKKGNEIATLDSITVSDNDKRTSHKFNPLTFNQDRAQRFRARARSTSMGRPQFKLSKKYIDQASGKGITNKEMKYWHHETTSNSERTTCYSESDVGLDYEYAESDNMELGKLYHSDEEDASYEEQFAHPNYSIQ